MSESKGGAGVWLNRHGRGRRHQLLHALRRTRASRQMLALLWTAGPVTVLGLYGGYYIGFGRPPATELLIYFISFTVLSGLIGIAAKIIYSSNRAPIEEQAAQDELEAIDKLGELVLAVRDLMVDSFEGDVRRREAAMQLLQRVELSPEGVAFACEELTGDAELGRALAKIDMLSRAGLHARVRDIQADSREHFERAIAQLQDVAPLAATRLHERFMAQAPKLLDGVPRSDFFVERVLAAVEADDPLLMTLADVEEMLVLVFELINGRELPILTFHYVGRWRLAEALDQLENRRSQFRVAQAAGSNRVRALASWLVEVEILSYAEVPDGLPAQPLIERVVDALNRLTQRVDAAHAAHAAATAHPPFQAAAERVELEHASGLLTTALRLYKTAYQSFLQVGKAHADMLKASAGWNQLVERSAGPSPELRVGPGRRGLRIIEGVLALEPDQRTAVCQHLLAYLHGEHIEQRQRGHFARRATDMRPLTLDSARRLAVEIALALEPHILLSRPEIQRGVTATLASYLGDLEPGMSALAKRNLGEAMARDVQQDMSRAAEQLALALVKHYRVELTESASRFLQDNYGARPEILGILTQHLPSELPARSFLSARPAVLPAASLEWYRCLVRARRVLQR